jgi:two-component system OmpR family sensor kinase
MISFLFLYDTIDKREDYFKYKRNVDVSKMVNRELKYRGITKELEENLKSMHYSIISNIKEQHRILESKKINIIQKIKRKHVLIYHIKSRGKHLIYINAYGSSVILKDNTHYIDRDDMLVFVLIAIVLAFLLLYIITIRKLLPLKQLQKKMKALANENFDIDLKTDKKDEISILANEFNSSALKLKSLKESRNVFLRNIMHELKTPITKGKVLTQLEHTDANNEKMQKVFYRLESLISEFTFIEELISTKKELKRKEYHLVDIIDNSIDILMPNDNEVIEEYENILIKVDFQLFSIAIKNLLDNAIKYSRNKEVIIKTVDNNIVFENKGNELEYPLESYYEAFFKGDDIKSNQSFGLGLYIVHHILKANHCSLSYEYENETSKFILST